MLQYHIQRCIGTNSHTKTFPFFPRTLIIHALEITMLSWYEEVTPTASLSPSSSRSDPLLAARFSVSAFTFPGASIWLAAAAAPSLATSTPNRLTTDSTRRVNAVCKRIVSGSADANQLSRDTNWSGIGLHQPSKPVPMDEQSD
jgi:hypothetical protein